MDLMLMLLLGVSCFPSFVHSNTFPNDCPKECSCTTETIDPSDKRPPGIKVLCISKEIKILRLEKLPVNTIEIDLSANHIETIRKNSFPYSSTVRKLYIRKNNIATIEDGAFSNLPSLQKLDLEDNDIMAIYRKTFDGLTFLRNVDLGTNKLKFIDDDAFVSTRLRKLFLANNKLVTLPRGLRVLSLRSINVENNNLLCHCNMQWVSDWIKEFKVVISENSICSMPKSMNKKPLTSVASETWKCTDHLFEVPSFQLQPSGNQVVFESDSVALSCSSMWLPFGKFRWFKSGKQIISGNSTVITYKHSLEKSINGTQILITNFSREDIGQYMCELSVPWNANVNEKSQLRFFSEEIPFCNQNHIISEKGSFLWNNTAGSGVSSLKCPYGSSKPLSTATRNCSLAGSWRDMDSSFCLYKSALTQSLYEMSQVSLNQTNFHDFKFKLIQFETRNITTVSDLHFFSKILHSLANHQYTFKITSTLGAFILRTISKIADVSDALLLNAENNGGFVSKLTNVPFVYAQHALDNNVNSVHSVSSDIALHSSVIPMTNSASVGCVVKFRFSAKPKILKDASLNCTLLTGNSTFGREALDAGIVVSGEVFRSMTSSSISKSTSASVTFVAVRRIKLFPEVDGKTLTKRSPNTEMSSVAFGVNISVPGLSRKRRDVVTVKSIIIFRHLEEGRNPRIVAWQSTKDNRFGWHVVPSCYLNSTNGNYSQFTCNDMPVGMTYLALAADVIVDKVPEIFHLEFIIIIGAGICCLFLILTFIFFVSFREIRYNRSDVATLMNLCITISILVITFALGVNRVDEPLLCRTIGVILHYTLLATLIWLGCGGMCVHSLVKKGYANEEYYPVFKYYLLGWGIPLIVCGITYAGNTENYAISPYCWLDSSVVLGALVGPASLLLLVDVIIFIRLHLLINRRYPEDRVSLPRSPLPRIPSRRVTNNMHNRKIHSQLNHFTFPSRYELHDFLRGNFMVLLLICASFGCAIMIFSFRRSSSRYLYIAFSYCYAFCTALLGFAVFLFNCIRRERVRRMLLNSLTFCYCCKTNEELGIGQENALLLDKEQVTVQGFKNKNNIRVSRSGYNSELTYDQSDAISGVSMATSVFLTNNDTSRPSSLVCSATAVGRKDLLEKMNYLTTVNESNQINDKELEMKELDALLLSKDFPSEKDTLLGSDMRVMSQSDHITDCIRRPLTIGSASESGTVHSNPPPRLEKRDPIWSKDDTLGMTRSDRFASNIPVAVVQPFSSPLATDDVSSSAQPSTPNPLGTPQDSPTKSLSVHSPSTYIPPKPPSDKMSTHSQTRSITNSINATPANVPNELVSFVPANWRPVRKGGKSASFYPIMDHNQRHLPRTVAETPETATCSPGVSITRQANGSISSRATTTTTANVISPQRHDVKPKSSRSDSRKRRRRKHIDPDRPRFDDIPCRKEIIFIPIPETSRVEDPVRNETSV